MVIDDVEIPGGVRDFKKLVGGQHEARERVDADPAADRAAAQRFFDHRPPGSKRGHHPPLAVLPLDFVDTTELVEQGVFQPLSPQAAQHGLRRGAQRLDAGRTQH